jgi:hypothetical protein
VVFLRHLPMEHRSRSTWRYVAAELNKATAGADTADVSIALSMALMLEKVECDQRDSSPLPAAVVHRRARRLLRRPRPQRPAARLCLFRGCFTLPLAFRRYCQGLFTAKRDAICDGSSNANSAQKVEIMSKLNPAGR